MHGGIITGVGLPERSFPVSRPGYSAVESGFNEHSGHVKVHLVDVSISIISLTLFIHSLGPLTIM